MSSYIRHSETGEGTARERIRRVGSSAWRTTVLVGVTLLILVMYVGLAFLVYQDRISDGPLVLFTGVIVGYLLRVVQDAL